MKKFFALFCLLSVCVLSCEAGYKIKIAPNIYIDNSSIIKSNNKKKKEISYYYLKTIYRDSKNSYKIPFFDDKSDFNKKVKSIGYANKVNCAKKTITVRTIYLYDSENKLLKKKNIKSRKGGYVMPVKNGSSEENEYKILCECRNKLFFRNSDEY